MGDSFVRLLPIWDYSYHLVSIEIHRRWLDGGRRLICRERARQNVPIVRALYRATFPFYDHRVLAGSILSNPMHHHSQ